MKFCQENWKDIQKYFQGSYMKFPSFAGDVVHMVDRVDEDKVRGKFYAGGEIQPFEFALWSMEDEEHNCPDVDFVLPIKSWFAGPNGEALFLYRNPSRQYRRGVCEDNTNVEELSYGEFEARSLTLPILTAYVGKQAFPGFAGLAGRHGKSTVLSQRIAVSDSGMLYADKTKIGKVDFDKKLVFITEPLFVPEVSALLGGGYVIGERPKTVPKARKLTAKYGVDEDGNVVKMEALNG